jgi:hypothetical protein
MCSWEFKKLLKCSKTSTFNGDKKMFRDKKCSQVQFFMRAWKNVHGFTYSSKCSWFSMRAWKNVPGFTYSSKWVHEDHFLWFSKPLFVYVFFVSRYQTLMDDSRSWRTTTITFRDDDGKKWLQETLTKEIEKEANQTEVITKLASNLWITN